MPTCGVKENYHNERMLVTRILTSVKKIVQSSWRTSGCDQEDPGAGVHRGRNNYPKMSQENWNGRLMGQQSGR